MRGKHINADIMTKEDYARTQKDARRIEGTTRGRAAVVEFIEAWHLRKSGEQPNSDVRQTTFSDIAGYVHLFLKYAISVKIDQPMGDENSEIYVYAIAPDGEDWFWNNLVGSSADVLYGAGHAMVKMATRLLKEIKELPRDE